MSFQFDHSKLMWIADQIIADVDSHLVIRLILIHYGPWNVYVRITHLLWTSFGEWYRYGNHILG